MSALRLGRLPDGTRDIRILEPAVGRIHPKRYAIAGGIVLVPSGVPAVGVSAYQRTREHAKEIRDAERAARK